jgi:hypothetical protein
MNRDQIKDFFLSLNGILQEQEEPDAEEEIGSEEEAEDVDTEDVDDGDDETGEDEEEVDVEEEDVLRFEKSLDDQLQSMLVDIESQALKSARVQVESYSLKRVLLKEAKDVELDTARFASELARVILNFESFFSIEDIVIKKTRQYLLDKYGKEIAEDVEEILDSEYDIKTSEKIEIEKDSGTETPIAVGATGGGGGGV